MASQDWLDKDFYRVLEVDKGVSDADLKKQYRKLARKYHPDSNQGNAAAESRFKEVSEAYSVLSDAEQRKEYDAIRAMGGGARFTSGGANNGGFEDVFGTMFNGQRRGGADPSMDDLLSGLFAGGDPRRRAGFGGPTKGADQRASLTISFRSAIAGETKSLRLGETPVKVRIPAGVKDGQTIRLSGRGAPSSNGGPNGDLLVKVQVTEHPVFKRDGSTLRVSVPVTFVEAALGAVIEVPTLDGGIVKLKVPAGTTSGKVLRVKGRGVTVKGETGDLLATIEVAVPSHLTSKQKDALKAFEEVSGDENPREDFMASARS